MGFLPVVAFILLSIISERGVASECLMTDDECVFHFNVEHKLTMMKDDAALFTEGGKLYRYDVRNTSSATPVDPEGVIQADGYETQRYVTVVNGMMPGPNIEVYEGQTIIVHVKNHLFNEGTTIHWHGLPMKGTQFSDGVAFITQCPILPLQTFMYKFKAEPVGTFWYHSHVEHQRTMGLFGALIVREKKPLVMKEHIMQIQDWNNDVTTLVFLKMRVGGFENRTLLPVTTSPDGTHFSRYYMKSGLINGKGRLHYKEGGHNGAPLTLYKVKQGEKYRFRVIGVGNLYPFRVSVDGHDMTVVASDGYELQPRTAESFIINPGERYDFVLNANQPVGNYWVRARTLEIDVDHTAEAILRYDGAPEVEPTTSRGPCTAEKHCAVIACPFPKVYPEPYTDCVRFDELRSLANDDPAPAYDKATFEEHFLNFAFLGKGHTPSLVNGKAFLAPNVAALSQRDEIDTFCEDMDCPRTQTCHCTHDLKLKHNDVVQMVFIHMDPGNNWNHPIHLHGHAFHVLKMGYANQDTTTGQLIRGMNRDLNCRNHCWDAQWRNQSWLGDNIPGLELKNAPRKDTITVPARGYVIVRFRADNPGVWFMHCHIEMHNSDGMAMMVTEGLDHHPKPPPNWRTCGSWGPDVKYARQKQAAAVEQPYYEGSKDTDVNSQEGDSSYNKPSNFDGTDLNEGDHPPETEDTFWVVVGSLIALCVLLCCVIAFMWLTLGKRRTTSTTVNKEMDTTFDHTDKTKI